MDKPNLLFHSWFNSSNGTPLMWALSTRKRTEIIFLRLLESQKAMTASCLTTFDLQVARFGEISQSHSCPVLSKTSSERD